MKQWKPEDIKMFRTWATILFIFGCWKVCNMDTFYLKADTHLNVKAETLYINHR